MRFLHLADLHLDTAFASRSGDVRRRLREAIRAALRAAVTLAIDERLDAVLVAGDLFDGERISFETERVLLGEVERLAGAGIPFLYATGNHDPAPTLRPLVWPAGVEVFGQAAPRRVAVQPRGGPVVGYVTGCGHESARVTDNLAATFPAADSAGDVPEVALLHAMIDGADASDGHDRYAPGSIDDLRGRGYHYWALGHVHRRQELCADPPCWYAGCPQGRTPAESGPRGANLVTLRRGQPAEVRFVPLGPVVWETHEITGLEAVRSLEELFIAVAGRLRGVTEAGTSTGNGTSAGNTRLLRVRLRGGCPLHVELRDEMNREFLATQLSDDLQLVAVELDCTGLGPPVDLATARARRDVLGEALRLLAEARLDASVRAALAPPELAGFHSASQAGAHAGPPADPAARDAYLLELLADAEPTLLALLIEDRA